jgi:hypothetical protein
MDIVRHVSQRYRWVLAVSVAAGAALLALHGMSPTGGPRDRPRAVVEVAAPDIQVPVEVTAPDIQVPVEVATGGESRLRRIAALLALFGVVLYVYLTIVYDHFYSVLHVEPADVGLSYGTTLSRSSGLILVVVAIAGAALFLLRWIRTWLRAVFATVFEVPPLAIFPRSTCGRKRSL